jgi:adenosine deaminase
MTSNDKGHIDSDTPKKLWPALILILLLAIVPIILSHSTTDPSYSVTLTTAETRATRAFEHAKSLGEPRLYAFLRNMPKGADLHMHLSGAIYAETFIDEAARAGLCVAPPPACPASNAAGPQKTAPHGAPCPTPVLDPARPKMPLSFAQPGSSDKLSCPAGDLPASAALTNQALYDGLIDSFSMRAFVPTPGVDGHDQFFATFARFSGLKSFGGEWLNEVAQRAASQNEQYLEIMHTPSFSNAAAIGYKLGWTAGNGAPSDLATLRDALLAGGLRNDVAIDSKELDTMEASRQSLEACGSANPAPGCGVQVRYLYQVLRGFPPQQVFAQTLLGFELASSDPRVVGINYVMPEDGYLSMSEYHRQMHMLDYLHSVYPQVHISLHAGELAEGMVAPDGLTFHIREAIELGHAERIGHGIDIGYETDTTGLLREMAQKNVMVEINLTSNDVILGIKGEEHPLSTYMAAHVPVALSTDDEGVSRIDLTHEYVRAAEEQGLDYRDLKQMARTSLEHAFLPGASLWASPTRSTRWVQMFNVRQSACAAPVDANKLSPGPCRDFLKNSERATQQYELERRFADFEAAIR